MGQENYAYAVATIRVKETALLSADFMEQLLAASSYEAARKLLVERNWLPAVPSGDDDAFLQKQIVETWELIKEIAPKPELLYGLILKNDFHNLKAAVKCSFGNYSPEQYFLQPCTQDVASLADDVSNRNFDSLPEMMRSAAKDAYDVFVRTQDGQYADVYVDTAALTAIRLAGRRSDNKLMDSVTELICAASDIKTAVRSAQTKKDAHFLDSALCACDTLDKHALTVAAIKGEKAVHAYLMTTAYKEAAKSLDVSQSAFEKWFDDLIMEQVMTAKYIFFGPEPLIAYYIAREAEIKNVRILLSGKRHGAKDKVLRERMRRLYV